MRWPLLPGPVVGVLVALAPGAAEPQAAYAVTDNHLFRVDFGTGTTTLIGEYRVGPRPILALALSPDGVLYASVPAYQGVPGAGSPGGELWTIDPATAAATFRGYLGVTPPGSTEKVPLEALDFGGPHLYGAVRSSPAPAPLYRVDLATLTPVFVAGAHGIGGSNHLIAIAARDAGTIYYSSRFGTLYVQTLDVPGATAPRSLGATTGPTGAVVGPMDFLSDGQLYGFRGARGVRIRPGDGAVTELFATNDNFRAMTSASAAPLPPKPTFPVRTIPDAVTLGACVSRPTTVSQPVFVLPARDPYSRGGGYVPAASIGVTLRAAGGGPAPAWLSARVAREHVTFLASTAGLAVGTYAASAVVTATGGDPVTVPIELTVGTGPAIGIAPGFHEFGSAYGPFSGSSTQGAIVTNVGCGGPLAAVGVGTRAAPGWYPRPDGVRAEPDLLTGTFVDADQILTASLHALLKQIPNSSYDAFRVTAAGAVSVWLPAVWRVGDAPSIAVHPSTVRFGAVAGSAAAVPPQLVFLTNAGGGTLTALGVSAPEYAAGQPTGWLTPSLYRTGWLLRLDANPAGLAAGTYTALVRVTAAGTSTDQHAVLVTLAVRNPSAADYALIRTAPTPLVLSTPGGTAMPVSREVEIGSLPTVAPGEPGWPRGGVTGIGEPFYGVGPPGWASATIVSHDGGLIDRVRIAVNPWTLTAGVYAASFPLTTPGAVNNPSWLTVVAEVWDMAATAVALDVDAIAPEAAAADLLGGPPLAHAERLALDAAGNRNGTFDLGDVLAHADRAHRPLAPATLARLLASPPPRTPSTRKQP